VASAAVKIRWTDIAVADLKSTHEYPGEHSPEVADALIERVLSAIDILERYPNLGRLGRIEGTREFVVTGTRFHVFYRLRHEQLEILGILHGARKWPDRSRFVSD
jgi:plasmid stabilization system protein ParE